MTTATKKTNKQTTVLNKLKANKTNKTKQKLKNKKKQIKKSKIANTHFDIHFSG